MYQRMISKGEYFAGPRQKNTGEVTKTHMVFWSSLGGRYIFVQGWKIWANPYGKIDRRHHQHIIMEGIWFLRFILVL